MQANVSQQTVRVVLADDHALTRAGFRLLLEQVPGVEVVGEAGDGEELVRLAAALEPDIVFTDIEMPRLDGFDAIRAIANALPDVRCVVVSMHSTAAMVKRAAICGAAGYVMKDASPREFEHAIASIATSGSYYSPAVSTLLLAKTEALPHELLTERQVEILKRVANGQSTKEIAYDLHLSTKTVDAHRVRIMERLALRDVASLSRYAFRHRLVSL
ncbi:MAG: response regulator transcription factor [Pseudomonadota bacterium]